MYLRDELLMYSFESYFRVCIPHCCATREINTNLTLLRAHKQIATQVQILFFISFTRQPSQVFKTMRSLGTNEISNIKMSRRWFKRFLLYFDVWRWLDLMPSKSTTQIYLHQNDMGSIFAEQNPIRFIWPFNEGASVLAVIWFIALEWYLDATTVCAN